MRKNKIIQVTTVWHFSLPASLYLHKSSIFSFSHSRCLFISFSSKHKAGRVTSRFFFFHDSCNHLDLVESYATKAIAIFPVDALPISERE